jgi:hypothetical protein
MTTSATSATVATLANNSILVIGNRHGYRNLRSASNFT